MNSKWFTGINRRNAEDKEKRRAFVHSASPQLDLLKEILLRDLRALEEQQEAKANYEKPAWTALQADYLATRRTLKELIALLDLDQREE